MPRGTGMRRMSTLLRRGRVVMPRSRCLLRLPGVLGRLVTIGRSRMTRMRRKHGQGEETSQPPDVLVHSVVSPATSRNEP